jgi:flagellar P-ring protein precursor FlgI
MKVDVTVSSVGDAKSIEGGVLLLTALRATNGKSTPRRKDRW